MSLHNLGKSWNAKIASFLLHAILVHCQTLTIAGLIYSVLLLTKADAPTIRIDCHPIPTNWHPNLCHPHHFTPDALPGTTLSIYPGLEQAPNMLASIPSGWLSSLCSIISRRWQTKIWHLGITPWVPPHAYTNRRWRNPAGTQHNPALGRSTSLC